jgi:hypothetical protein
MRRLDQGSLPSRPDRVRVRAIARTSACPTLLAIAPTGTPSSFGTGSTASVRGRGAESRRARLCGRRRGQDGPGIDASEIERLAIEVLAAKSSWPSQGTHALQAPVCAARSAVCPVDLGNARRMHLLEFLTSSRLLSEHFPNSMLPRRCHVRHHKRRTIPKTSNLQVFYAPEWTRTTTDRKVHKALNLARLPIPPRAQRCASIALLDRLRHVVAPLPGSI